MEIAVTRKPTTLNYTEGVMELEPGVRFCDTLEDTVRIGEKVLGKTAIPPGRYRVKMTYSNRFKKVMPQLMNVPGFEGIRIHSGNTEADTYGCILIGQSDSPGHVSKSRDTYNVLVYELEADKSEHFITIV